MRAAALRAWPARREAVSAGDPRAWPARREAVSAGDPRA
jgi:hypothetical protein